MLAPINPVAQQRVGDGPGIESRNQASISFSLPALDESSITFYELSD